MNTTLKVLVIIVIAIHIGRYMYQVDTCTPEQIITPITPMPTQTPPITPIPTQIQVVVDTSSLNRYDTDGNGRFDDFELAVIKTDYHYKRLSHIESDTYVALIGHTPSEIWSGTAIVVEPTPEPEYPGTMDELNMILGWWAEDVPEMYVLDVVDCSDMSGYLCDMLDAWGFDAHYTGGELLPHGEITVGDTVYPAETEGGGHACVIVYMRDGVYLIESTQGCIVPYELTGYYVPEYIYTSVEEYIIEQSKTYTHDSVVGDVDGMAAIGEHLTACGWTSGGV